MADIDVVQWLEQWVELNLHSQGHVERKAEMHDQAKACAEQAKGAGVSIVAGRTRPTTAAAAATVVGPGRARHPRSATSSSSMRSGSASASAR